MIRKGYILGRGVGSVFFFFLGGGGGGGLEAGEAGEGAGRKQ